MARPVALQMRNSANKTPGQYIISLFLVLHVYTLNSPLQEVINGTPSSTISDGYE